MSCLFSETDFAMKRNILKGLAFSSIFALGLLGGSLLASEAAELEAAGAKVRLTPDGQVLVIDARKAPEFTGESLVDLPALKDLKLNGMQVTDATLPNLASFTSLASLALDKTAVSDAVNIFM